MLWGPRPTGYALWRTLTSGPDPPSPGRSCFLEELLHKYRRPSLDAEAALPASPRRLLPGGRRPGFDGAILPREHPEQTVPVLHSYAVQYPMGHYGKWQIVAATRDTRCQVWINRVLIMVFMLSVGNPFLTLINESTNQKYVSHSRGLAPSHSLPFSCGGEGIPWPAVVSIALPLSPRSILRLQHHLASSDHGLLILFTLNFCCLPRRRSWTICLSISFLVYFVRTKPHIF